MMIDLSQLEVIKTESDIEKEILRSEALTYLKSTDWYVIRKIEIDKAIPEDVVTKRAEARENLK